MKRKVFKNVGSTKNFHASTCQRSNRNGMRIGETECGMWNREKRKQKKEVRQPRNEVRPSYLLLAAAFLEIQSHHLISNVCLRTCQDDKGSRSR